MTRPRRSTRIGRPPAPVTVYDVERKVWHVGNLGLIRCCNRSEEPYCEHCFYCLQEAQTETTKGPR